MTGETNGNGYAEVARLGERSFAHGARLDTLEARADAFEALLIEREKEAARGVDVRGWLPQAAIIGAGILVVFQFGIKPLENKDAGLEKAIVMKADKDVVELQFSHRKELDAETTRRLDLLLRSLEEEARREREGLYGRQRVIEQGLLDEYIHGERDTKNKR